MNDNLNVMVLNDVNIGISKIELDKSDLRIIDKSCKYCLQVCVRYSWKDINNIKAGTKEKIDFNECCLSLNNENALIIPSESYVEKISDDLICFNLNFKDLSQKTVYMNKKGRFDIELNSLEVKVFINYKDAKDETIKYDYKKLKNK